MKINPVKDSFKNLIVVASDRAAAGHVNRVFQRSSVKVSRTIAKTRGCISEASKLVGENRVLLVLVPSPSLGTGQLALTRHVVEAGGFVLAWVSHDDNGTASAGDDWYLARLLEQQGAITMSRLACLVETLRIISLCGGNLPQAPVFIKSGSNSMRTRLVSELKSAGIRISKTKSKKARLSFSISADGEISLKMGNRPSLAVENLSSFAKSLAQLVSMARPVEGLEEPVVEPERSEIELIVRTPARLLSETASKRVARAFGVESPEEQLCQSPSEAVRFAGALGSPVTLKLVKPGLENKKAVGAIISDISGAAAIRRAVQSLLSLASVMGPPKPLGILVSKQIGEGAGIWMKMHDHAALGRMILIGGERPQQTDPRMALCVPITATQAQAALVRAGVVPLSPASAKLAKAIARISVLASELGPAIDRLDIDSLIASDESDEALACDVLMGIGGG